MRLLLHDIENRAGCVFFIVDRSQTQSPAHCSTLRGLAVQGFEEEEEEEEEGAAEPGVREDSSSSSRFNIKDKYM